MHKETIGKAKMLIVSLEPGMVIDEETSEAAMKTLMELINIAKTGMEIRGGKLE